MGHLIFGYVVGIILSYIAGIILTTLKLSDSRADREHGVACVGLMYVLLMVVGSFVPFLFGLNILHL